MNLKSLISIYPDFPKNGINFLDFSPVFSNVDALFEISNEIYNLYWDKGITKVIGLETRGIIFGSIASIDLSAGFIMARKKGKLPPCDLLSASYEKEYGFDALFIEKDLISPEDVVLIHDDCVFTGGSMEAVIKILKKVGVKQIYANTIYEETSLNGRKKLEDLGVELTSIIKE